MATYKIKGKRFVRKYTEKEPSPVYAAAVQAQNIVKKFCDVPWTETDVEDARMSYHTEESVDGGGNGLDRNVEIRDAFDAALFCAGHVGGSHRAYANAAVYRYEMPGDAVGKTVRSLSMNVTSDPYNTNGARLHVFTNTTGEVPTNCNVLRGNDESGKMVEDGTTAGEVAKRTVKNVNGTDYWYPTNETCTLEPNLVLQKYLFIFVGLESYSTVRGNWLEGSSFIENEVAVSFDAEVNGLTTSSVNDLSSGLVANSDEIAITVIADADLSGKLWVQVVTRGYSRRVIKKWSFPCNFSYGNKEMTIRVPSKIGNEKIISIGQGVFFEAWVGKEKYEPNNDYYGYMSGVDESSVLELTRSSPIFDRIDLYDRLSNRKEMWGKDDGSSSAEDLSYVDSKDPLSGGVKNRVRIVPYLISGTKQDNALNPEERKPIELLMLMGKRLSAEFEIDKRMRPYITEVDVIGSVEFDIDWGNSVIEEISKRDEVVSAVGDLTAVKYGIVIGNEIIPFNSIDDGRTVRCFNELVERRYQPKSEIEKPVAEVIKIRNKSNGRRAEFSWRMFERENVGGGGIAVSGKYGCSYTAFKIRIINDKTGEIEYDSRLKKAPAIDNAGILKWQAPQYVTELLESDKAATLKWCVSMYNSKYKPNDNSIINEPELWSDEKFYIRNIDKKKKITIRCGQKGGCKIVQLNGLKPTGEEWLVTIDEYEDFELEVEDRGYYEYEIFNTDKEGHGKVKYGCTHGRNDNVLVARSGVGGRIFYDRMKGQPLYLESVLGEKKSGLFDSEKFGDIKIELPDAFAYRDRYADADMITNGKYDFGWDELEDKIFSRKDLLDEYGDIKGLNFRKRDETEYPVVECRYSNDWIAKDDKGNYIIGKDDRYLYAEETGTYNSSIAFCIVIADAKDKTVWENKRALVDDVIGNRLYFKAPEIGGGVKFKIARVTAKNWRAIDAGEMENVGFSEWSWIKREYSVKYRNAIDGQEVVLEYEYGKSFRLPLYSTDLGMKTPAGYVIDPEWRWVNDATGEKYANNQSVINLSVDGNMVTLRLNLVKKESVAMLAETGEVDE